ncbi:MAG: substrate-binding domain-containing protein [Methanohalobium sp.]|uniref:substrate-binding domain-containing protein n=1 Tax=Methanohalobium sp. TaxID=2837493 RepID=UPI00397B241E
MSIEAIKEKLNGLFENNEGVSPIVATLVLVVVAIAGAAAVGSMMGTFSDDVSDDADTGDMTKKSSTTLNIQGSTTVAPVSEAAAEAYMENNPVEISVSGGGSGAGVSGAEMGTCDIGASSHKVDLDDHSELQEHVIGASAVSFIASEDVSVSEGDTLTKQDLKDLYKDVKDDGTIPNGDLGDYNLTTDSDEDLSVYQRDKESGTEETASGWITDGSSKSFFDETNATGKIGNPGVLKAVEDTECSLGFVDYGFVADSTSASALDVDGYKADTEAIKNTLSDTSTDYPEDLTRYLVYLTNGEPTPQAEEFINFVKSSESYEYFDEMGYFPIGELQ